MAEKLLKKFPDDPAPLYRLISLSIRKRDFAAAHRYVEMLRKQKPDDAYNLRDCYYYLSNLAVWEGKFKQSMDDCFAALEQARATGDSTLVSRELDRVATYYQLFDVPDSAFVYAMKSYELAAPIERVDRVVSMISIDTSYSATARPMFRKSLDDFKAHVPREFWSIADRIEPLFEANAKADTTAIIEVYRALIEERGELQSLGNVRELGVNLVLFGEYAEGRNTLERFLSGQHETTSGWYYPYILYLTGIANEALGNEQEAIENFREMLGYWSNPEIELKEIKDARLRLARLTS